jgi:hypothetical protein
MKLYSLQVPKDDAWNVMNELGDIGHCQFLDLNKDEAPGNLAFTRQIKSCEESERKLAYLFDQCKKHYVEITPPENVEGFIHQLTKIKENKNKAISLLLDDIQKDIGQQEKFIQEQNSRLKESESTLTSLKDCYQVFKVAQRMIPQLNNQAHHDIEQKPSGVGEQRQLIDKEMKTINIERCAGVVDAEEVPRFRKLIFRATKGKSYMFAEQFENIDDQDSTNSKQKAVYIITYYDGAHTRDKI